MLPTEKEPIKGDLLLRHIWKNNPKLECKSLWQYKDTITIDGIKQYTVLNGSFRDICSSFKPKQLLIISDDEIKEGDWYSSPSGIISQHNGKEILPKGWFKIIASYPPLNIEIKTKEFDVSFSYKGCQPQPSQQFIEKYIESYNKGEDITDILIEYEEYNHHHINYCGDGRSIKSAYTEWRKKVKINPKDNTITIKPVKDSWNREELIENMWEAYKQANTIFTEEGLRNEFNKWLKLKRI